MKILTVVGARPQFVKAAVISSVIASKKGKDKKITEKILHTGQHFDPNMSEQFFMELGIPEPAFNLSIGGGSHGENTGRMLEAIEKILLVEGPDAVLLYGDTDSTLAGALAASKLKIMILHVEAGLRSYNRHQPEEQNRVITDHLADVCFAPTDRAVKNLINEGIKKKRVVRTGDVMADSSRIFGEVAETNSSKLLKNLNLPVDSFILATIHRAENTDDPRRLNEILTALVEAPLPVILPLHPRTRARIKEHRLNNYLNHLTITSPLSFLIMLLLERRSSLVVTDSGGVQKEAYLQGTPCVTVREETEWVELLDCGWNMLADPCNSASIVSSMNHQINMDANKHRPTFYGDGYAADEIVAKIEEL